MKLEGAKKEIVSTSIYLLVVLLVTYLVITYVGQRTTVNGQSMETTLQDGDNLIVDKISYRFRDPERFEIVVFPVNISEELYDEVEDVEKIETSVEYYIKRVIGLPGETVDIRDQQVYINGNLLDEHYGKEPILTMGDVEFPITLGPDEYFVLGDNRNKSTDSRWSLVGNVTKDRFVGKAWIRIYPFDKFGTIKHE